MDSEFTGSDPGHYFTDGEREYKAGPPPGQGVERDVSDFREIGAVDPDAHKVGEGNPFVLMTPEDVERFQRFVDELKRKINPCRGECTFHDRLNRDLVGRPVLGTARPDRRWGLPLIGIHLRSCPG